MSSFKDCRPTISRSPRVPCGNRTHLAGLEDQGLCHSAKGTKRKERESNPQGSTLGRFRDGCHRQLACPSVRAAAAGIEPAIVSLTGSRLTIWATPQTSREGGLRTHGLRFPKPADWPAFLPLEKSTQRELNPHVLHGEQAGCRYITGAGGTRGT
jgi:hypothetical protein